MSFNTSLAPLSRAPELCKLSAAELIAQFRSGEISPVEVTQSVLEHAQEVQSRFNAFTLIDHQGALDLAKASEKRWSQGAPLSPIDGVPTTIKDLIWFKDRAIRYGSLTSASEPCAEDAPCVRNLRANGAVFIGVTTSPEMGWKAVTDSKAFGITRNPWHPEMTAGGSSGGAAVAAATGAGVLHVGTIHMIEQGVLDGRYHLGLVPEHRPSETLNYDFLFDEKMFLYVAPGHDWFEGPEPIEPWRDLREQRLAGLDYHSPNMQITHVHRLERSAHASDQEAVAAMVLSGVYAGFLPDHYAKPWVLAKQLKAIAPRALNYQCRYVCILRKHPEPLRVAQAFQMCLLKAHAHESVG